MAPFGTMELSAQARHDVYVMAGTVLEHGRRHAADGFFSRSHAIRLQAESAGATVFMYRDRATRRSGNETWHFDELVWHEGDSPGMAVALLSKTHHRLALVSWQRGTRAAAHSHPHGEEIFVLRGELCDERGAYPAGSWLRLHPGSNHSPYADQDTLILLRNGHLPGPTWRPTPALR